MFIGHFGIGFGAKKAAPELSLGTLFIAAQFLDLLWPTFLLLGWEHVEIEPGNTVMTPLNFTDYPLTHSLLMAIVWSAIIGSIYFILKRKYIGAFILGICVLSHWVLDLLVHGPDLPIYPGSPIFLGFGLWNHKVAAIILEGTIYITGILLYESTTTARNKSGNYGFWSLVFVLAALYIMNLTGPPPPSVTAIAWVGELQWLFVIWAFWVDKNRQVREKHAIDHPDSNSEKSMV